jgi:O-phosphoseryl-tRNA(Cys) synthetase
MLLLDIMEVTRNNATFFKELNRNIYNEKNRNNTYLKSLVNTYQNEPQFQTTENLSRNYARSGQPKFADPFAFHQIPLYKDNGKRNTSITDTLKINAKRDYPDVITANPLKVVGYY